MNNEFDFWLKKLEIKLLEADATFSDLYEIFVQMKRNGIEKEVAYNILIKLKKMNLTDQQDDLLVELMDIIENYCSPNLSIWD